MAIELIYGEVFINSAQYCLLLLRVVSEGFSINDWLILLNALQLFWLWVRLIRKELALKVSVANTSNMFILILLILILIYFEFCI